MIRRPIRKGRKETALENFVRKAKKALTVKKPSSKEEKEQRLKSVSAERNRSY